MSFLATAATIAGTCMGLSGVPQAIKIFQKKSAQDISAATFIILDIGAIVWVLYGIQIHNVAIIVSNSIGFTTNAIILSGWWKYGKEK